MTHLKIIVFFETFRDILESIHEFSIQVKQRKNAGRVTFPLTFPKLFKTIGENWVRTLDFSKQFKLLSIVVWRIGLIKLCHNGDRLDDGENLVEFRNVCVRYAP